MLRTATKSPFLTSRSTPWTAAPVSGVKSYSTRQKSSLDGSTGWGGRGCPSGPNCTPEAANLSLSAASWEAARALMSLPMRYGRPKAATRKTRKGFLERRGGAARVPSGRTVRPSKLANAAGVRAVASAGGGLPVILAINVRSHRRIVKMPRMEPSVFRRLPNCSATETIAIEVSISSPNNDSPRLTKETRMCSHVSTLQHLRKASECANNALNDLECGLCALTETMG